MRLSCGAPSWVPMNSHGWKRRWPCWRRQGYRRKNATMHSSRSSASSGAMQHLSRSKTTASRRANGLASSLICCAQGATRTRLCERSLQRALSQAILTMRLNMVLTAFWTKSAQGRADPGRRPVDSAKSLNTVSDSLAHLNAASTLAWIVGLDAVPVIVTGMPWLALPGAGLAAA